MSITDAMIIYLALGAPVAMFKFFQFERPFTLWGLANVLAAFILWPISAVDLIAESSNERSDASIFVTRKLLDVRIIESVEKLKEEILLEMADGGGREIVSSKAEALERYVGLSLADVDSSLSIGKEFFSVAGHPDEQVAVRCLARRNLKRLNRHRRDSAADLVAAYTHSANRDDRTTSIIEKLSQVADMIGDASTVAILDTASAYNGDIRKIHVALENVSTTSFRSHSGRSEDIGKKAA